MMKLQFSANKKLFVILLLAFALRLLFLNEKAFGVDETVTLSIFAMPFDNAIVFILNDFRPLLYYLPAYLLANFFSVFAAKLLSVFSGVLIVLFVYLIAKLEFSENTSLIAALLAALSPMLIAYSQHLREYNLLILFFLLSFFFFLKLIKDFSNRYLLFLSIANVFLLYTSYVSIIILFSQALIFCLLFWLKELDFNKLLKILFSLAISFFFFLPMLFILFNASLIVSSKIIERSILDFFYIFAKFASGFTFKYIFTNALFLVLPIILLNIAFIVSMANTAKSFLKSDIVNLTLLAFFVPLLLSLFFSVWMPIILNYRYMSFLLPLYLIISANFHECTKNYRLKVSLLFLIMASLLISDIYYYQLILQNDWNTYFGI